ARNVVAPAVLGVYAGDAATLDVDTALPRLAAMEREHGSVLRAAIAAGRKAGPGRSLSFPEGLEELPRALAAALGARRRPGRALAIAPAGAGGGWRVEVEGAAAAVEAERLMLALPGAEVAALLAPLAPDAAEALRAGPVAPVAVACLGFRESSAL